MKIEKLTKEQEEKLIVYKDKWLNKIFNYELYNSITEESVRNKIKELYKFCNLTEPIVILVDSPIACQIGINLLKVENQVGNQVWNQVWNQVGSQVENQVWNQVRSQVGNQVWNQVWNQVGNQVENQVWNQVENQVEKQVENQVEKLEYFNFSNYINYSDFGWLSFYDYFINENIIQTDIKEKLNQIIDFVNNCFISIQLNSICIVSKYPSKIIRNSQNQLHSTNESAISFCDGYEQHYFNEIYIKPELFQKLISKSYTFEDWSKETNEETKALVLAFYEEKFGGEFVFRFISQYLEEIDTYIDRLETEFLVIKKGGFIDYFLILADIFKWSKEQGIWMGIGRGSAAGSLISYFLDIVLVDPIKYGLLFERFLNEGRLGKSLPDIDSDVQGERRDENEEKRH